MKTKIFVIILALFAFCVTYAQDIGFKIPKNFNLKIDTLSLKNSIIKEANFDFDNNYLRVFFTEDPSKIICVLFSKKSLYCTEFKLTIKDGHVVKKETFNATQKDFSLYQTTRLYQSNSSGPPHTDPTQRAFYGSEFGWGGEHNNWAESIYHSWQYCTNQGYTAVYAIPATKSSFLDMVFSPNTYFLGIIAHGENLPYNDHFYLDEPIFYCDIGGNLSNKILFLCSCYQFDNYIPYLSSHNIRTFIGSRYFLSEGFWNPSNCFRVFWQKFFNGETIVNALREAELTHDEYNNQNCPQDYFQIYGDSLATINSYQPKFSIHNAEEITIVQEEGLSNKIFENFPNPFNPSTTIRYTIARNGFVSLKVYDILGREVRTLVDCEQIAGSHEIVFDASNLPTGIYYYKIQTENFSEIKRMQLLK